MRAPRSLCESDNPPGPAGACHRAGQRPDPVGDRRTLTQCASRHRLSWHVDEVRRWRRRCEDESVAADCAICAGADVAKSHRQELCADFFSSCRRAEVAAISCRVGIAENCQAGAAAPAHGLSCMQKVANRRWVLQSRGDEAPEDPAPCDRADATVDARETLCCWRASRRSVHVSLMRKLFFSSRRSNWSAVPAIRVGAVATSPSRFG
jgi:hypothetical protein